MTFSHHGAAETAPRGRAGEAGFTLIEVLVATVTSVVVSLALFAILEVATRQTAGVSERVHANQRGRLAMEYLTNDLHSSCVAVTAVPVLSGSTGTSLELLSERGTNAFFTSMTKHRIYLSGTTLYDAQYPSTGGVVPHWTFATTPSQTSTILTGVSQSGATALFTYYKYENSTLTEEKTTPLTEANAKLVAAVKLAMTVAPETKANSITKGKSIEVENTVLLRFDPASTTSQNTPCT
jgi:type II secretory pathway component PulJ